MMQSLEEISNIQLMHTFRFYLPNGSEEQKVCITQFQHLVNKLCGGSTMYIGKGSWISPDSLTITEDVSILEVYCDITPEEMNLMIRAFIEYGEKTDQQSLGVFQDGKYYLINLEEGGEEGK